MVWPALRSGCALEAASAVDKWPPTTEPGLQAHLAYRAPNWPVAAGASEFPE